MKESQILVAIVAPGEPVRLTHIENTLEAMQAAVGGYIELFAIVRGTDSIVGVCNEESLLISEPLAAFNPATRSFIHGTFFVAGDRDADGDEGREMCSLSGEQIAQVSHLFGPVAASSLDALNGPQPLENEDDEWFDE